MKESLLTSDLHKKNSDYLALTKKLNAEHFEHHKMVREIGDFCGASVQEERQKSCCE